MKQFDLTAFTVDQLVDRFAAIGVEQDKAEQAVDNAKYKRLFYQMNHLSMLDEGKFVPE